MKTRTKRILWVAAAFVLLMLLGGAVYIVSETNQVVITNSATQSGGRSPGPGLHLKLPFIQKANYFEKRWLAWDGDPNQIPTRDEKYIWVDTYCRWRIADPLVFFQRVNDERNAHSRLDDIVDGETRNTIAKFDLIEIVRSSNRDFEISEDAALLDFTDVAVKIEAGRRSWPDHPGKRLQNHPQFGVELKDVRNQKRVELRREVQRKVFRPDDRRAPTDRLQVPFRRRREKRRNPRPEGARAEENPVRGLQDRPRKSREKPTPRRRKSTPRPTTSTRSSTSS